MKSKNFLNYIPTISDCIDFDMNDRGELLLIVENRGFYNLLAQKLFHRSRISEIELDEMGSFVFPLIDGRRSIYDIAQSVREKFGDKAEPLYPRIVQYMKILQSYKYISFIKK